MELTMKIRKLLSTAIVSASVALVAPASAQPVTVDLSGVQAACATSGEACTLAVQAVIAALQALGLPPAALNTQLGVLASTAVSAAASLPPAEQVAVAGALEAIADASTDVEQIAALNTVSTALASGQTVDLSAEANSFSAS